MLLKVTRLGALVMLVCTNCQLLSAQPFTTTQDLLTALQGRYAGKWPTTLRFRQTTVQYQPGEAPDTVTWYEALDYRTLALRIDYGQWESGNGVVFYHDSVFAYKDGKLTSQRRYLNDLMLLLGGWHHLPLDQVITRLKASGYNLARLDTISWNGQLHYAVGGDPRTPATAQFWLEAERLLVTRIFIPTGQGGLREVQLGGYVNSGPGGWTETYVRFLDGPALLQEEFYHDLQTDVTLPAGVFRPAELRRP